MIELNELKRHNSSPLTLLGKHELMEQRRDLYSRENFYFGFESSNASFLDIIGNHKPLGIKYGPIFCLYHPTHNERSVELFWIEPDTKQLISLMTLKASAKDSGLVKAVLPFSFTSVYDECYQSEDEEIKPDSALYPLALVINQLTQGIWPDKTQYENLKKILTLIDKKMSATLTCIDLPAMEKSLVREKITPTADDFVSPLSLTNANENLPINVLLKLHPDTITLRLVNDNYPRVEIHIPGKQVKIHFEAVFKSEESQLFDDLSNSLADTKTASALLKTHLKDKLEEYFAEQGFDSPAAPSASS